jgi:hypothetical protein
MRRSRRREEAEFFEEIHALSIRLLTSAAALTLALVSRSSFALFPLFVGVE